MGYLFAFITVTIWSFNIILAKYFAESVMPFQISLGRWIIALMILFPFTIREIIKNRDIVIKNIKYIVILAILGVVFSNTFIYKAAQTTEPINIGLLQITFPLFLTILSVAFLHKSLDFKQIIGMIIAILGVVVVLVRGDLTELSKIKIHIGDGFMILNTMFFALYSFLQSKRPKELSQKAMLSLTALGGVIFLLPITYSFEGIPSLSQTNIELFVFLGIFNSVIAFLLWNTSLEKIGQIKAGMFFYLMPLLTAVFSFFIFGEKIVFFEVIGGVLIIGGLVLININNKKSKILQ